MADVGCIFLNYRREQSEWPTGRLHDRLVEVFGRERIFTDVDSIGPGQDFTKVLEDAVGSCRVLLAVIGRDWVNARDDEGRRRLENPHDWVRVEIESALRRPGVLVIPVFIDGAEMPRVTELPGALAQLSTRQGVSLSASGFARDTERLISTLQELFRPPPATPPRPPSTVTPHPPTGSPPGTIPPLHPLGRPTTAGQPPIAVSGYPVLAEDLQWSGPLMGNTVVERVAVRDGTWVKIGDPLFVLRSGSGPVTLWSTYIGQIQTLGYQAGQPLAPGRPLLTLAISGWLFRANARMPFDTGVLLASGAPSRRLDANGASSRLLVTIDNAGSRPVPWHSTCLLYVPDGSHVFSAIYELSGSRCGTTSEAVKIRRGRRVAFSYESPRIAGGSGKLRS